MNDLALSLTYFPDRKYAECVLYGCTENLHDNITRRLKKCDLGIDHPLILPTIFAEIERERHFGLYDKLRRQMLTRALNLPNNPKMVVDDSDSLTLWIQMSELRNGLLSWQQQLDEIINHVDELDDANFYTSLNDCTDSRESTPVNDQVSPGDKLDYALIVSDELTELKIVGGRIKRRLRELKGEYDEKIRGSAVIIDGMTLANQMVSWDRALR